MHNQTPGTCAFDLIEEMDLCRHASMRNPTGRSPWIVCVATDLTSSSVSEAQEEDTLRGGGPVTTEAEAPQAKDARSWRRQDGPSPRALGSVALAVPFLDFWPPELRENTFLWLQAPRSVVLWCRGTLTRLLCPCEDCAARPQAVSRQ